MTTTRGHIVRISDPSVSLERVYMRLHEEQVRLVDYQENHPNWTASIAAQKRRISALKASATRIGRMI